MRFEFTPAAERALLAAAAWASRDDSEDLELPEILLGLLAEPECRAALLLTSRGVDAARVQARFPTLAALDPPRPQRARQFSPAALAAFDAAERLLIEYPRPLSLATEHLLLGAAATDGEVACWLAEIGLTADWLEAEVHRLSGHQPGPLPFDIPDDAGEWAREASLPWNEKADEAAVEQAPAHEEIAVWRIIDAAANRASEGLRVVEDYLRFALDDVHLTAECKAIRHELATALAAFAPKERHAARDTQADVGTELTLATEQTRDGLGGVVQANFKRLEQSLRSLEEYSKTVAPETSAGFERLRYRVYTLERAVDVTRHSLDRLARAQLYVLVDGRESAEACERLVTLLIAAGVSMIQLRDKHLADRELLNRARCVRELTQAAGVLFIMNDRPDVAVLAGADGVHVGQEELTVKDARRILGPHGLIGVSTHSIAQARAAVLDGANYIGVGPTFPSGTKQFAEFTGVELLREVHAEIRLPAFAIGGISAANAGEVIAAGFSRIAVSGAITASADPAAEARKLLAILGDVRP